MPSAPEVPTAGEVAAATEVPAGVLEVTVTEANEEAGAEELAAAELLATRLLETAWLLGVTNTEEVEGATLLGEVTVSTWTSVAVT